MTDSLDSLDALANARKRCPNCGHDNRITAKVCGSCGHVFATDASEMITVQPTAALVHCPNCGHDNRAGAKICVNCGQPLPVTTLAAPEPAVQRAKRCPECSTICKLDAKVCPHCGHRFQTDFSRSEPLPGEAPMEAPIRQMPSEGITLPAEFEAPSRLPDLPPAVPRQPIPPVPTPVAAALPVPPAVPPPVDSPDTTEGEPAPDLTDVDLAALRGWNKPTGPFKKDRR